MNTLTAATAPVTAPRRHAFLHHWPSALGLAAAGFSLATGADRDSVAITITLATLCYLGAAALGRPWVAWAGIAGGTAIVFASQWIGLPWWAGVGIVALVLVVAGLRARVPRPALAAQTAALLGFGGVAVAGLFIAPRLGLLLAGVALASHAVWDLVHYRRNQVVPRSLAEFCIVLDVPLGVGAIILAITG